MPVVPPIPVVRLLAKHVQALRVAVAAGPVAPAIDYAGHRVDAEFVVFIGGVAGHGRPGGVDLDAVVAVCACPLALEQRGGRVAVDEDAVGELAVGDVVRDSVAV